MFFLIAKPKKASFDVFLGLIVNRDDLAFIVIENKKTCCFHTVVFSQRFKKLSLASAPIPGVSSIFSL